MYPQLFSDPSNPSEQCHPDVGKACIFVRLSALYSALFEKEVSVTIEYLFVTIGYLFLNSPLVGYKCIHVLWFIWTKSWNFSQLFIFDNSHKLSLLEAMATTQAPVTGTYRLPDIDAICQWKTTLNPHHEEVAKASSEWVLGFNFFTGQKAKFFRERSSEILTSFVYPTAGPEQLRTACDFINLLFIVDEISDDQDGKGARQTGQTLLQALKDPVYEDESKLCKMTKEYVGKLY